MIILVIFACITGRNEILIFEAFYNLERMTGAMTLIALVTTAMSSPMITWHTRHFLPPSPP
jgi:hypothetical protein